LAPVVILQKRIDNLECSIKSNESWRAQNNPLGRSNVDSAMVVFCFYFAKEKKTRILLRKTAAAPLADPARADTDHCVTRRQSLVLAKAKGRYGDAAFCVCFFLCAAFWLSLTV